MSDAARVFRTAKEEAFEQLLRPTGFHRGKNIYVRHATGQLHCIGFQSSTWGGSYFVNVGFHYDFLPGRLALANRQSVLPPEFKLLDFMMYCRLETLMLPGYPARWQYAGDSKTVTAEVLMNARHAVAAVDCVAHKWKEPQDFMKTLPPDVLRRDDQERERRSEMPVEESLRQPPFPVDAALGGDWLLERFYLAYGLLTIALRAGQRDLATEYLRLATAHARTEAERAVLRRISKSLATTQR